MNGPSQPTEKVYVSPGYICIAKKETHFHGVTGAGIIITSWDRERKYGGVCYFARPAPLSGERPTPFFARPAVKALLNLCRKYGAEPMNLEIHLYGGADNTTAPGYKPNLAQQNRDAAQDALSDFGFTVTGMDLGGNRGRKVVFNSATGEIITAKVSHIRTADWYPALPGSSKQQQ